MSETSLQHCKDHKENLEPQICADGETGIATNDRIERKNVDSSESASKSFFCVLCVLPPSQGLRRDRFCGYFSFVFRFAAAGELLRYPPALRKNPARCAKIGINGAINNSATMIHATGRAKFRL
jgi:hypothetical protein